jgi:putative DNA primase/helicase
MFVSNHRPRVHGDDPAVWARIRLIPFDVVIPAEQRDARLPETLREHADAILQWAIAGWRDYRERGMAEPASVIAATEEYKASSDDLARFLEQCCYTGRSAYVEIGELWERFSRWHRAEGGEEISKRAFGMALDKRGFDTDRAGGRRIRRGLGLLADDDEQPSDRPSTNGSERREEALQEYLLPSNKSE